MPSPSWIHATICAVLGVTDAQGAQGDQLFISTPGPWSLDQLESVVVDVLSEENSSLPAILRLTGAIDCVLATSERSKDDDEQAALKTMRDLFCSYILIVVQFPEMFPYAGVADGTAFIRRILRDLFDGDRRDVTARAFDAICASLDEKTEQTAEIFTPVLMGLREDIAKCRTIVDSFAPSLFALKTLVKHKEIALLMTRQPTWLPAAPNGDPVDGKALEANSFLGPFFAPTAIPESAQIEENPVIQRYFLNLDHRTQADVDGTVQLLEQTMMNLWRDLKDLSMGFLRRNETRDAFVGWLSAVVYTNEERSKMQFNPYIVSSDGFLCNVCAVLLYLCAPFTSLDTAEKRAAKMDLVDFRYLVSRSRIMYRDDETRLAMDTHEFQEWSAQYRGSADSNPGSVCDRLLNPPASFKFVTESFFLALRLMRLGVLRAMERMTEMVKAMQRMRSDPPSPEFLSLLQVKFAVDCVLQAPDIVTLSSALYRFATEWLLRLGEQSLDQAPPPPNSVPARALAAMPEHIVYDAATFLIFMARFGPKKLINGASVDYVGILAARFSGNGSWVKNAGVRTHVMEALTQISPILSPETESLAATLFRQPWMIRELPNALVRLYVDVEHTGDANQFYAKFSSRHMIALLLKYIWNIPGYTETIRSLCRSNAEQYLAFINMIINDATYLLDEVFEKLSEIKEFQESEANGSFASLPEETREERAGAFRQAERIAESVCSLSNETITMIKYLTADDEVQRIFLRPEMIDRVAAMLNYFLLELVGERSRQLIVRDPAKYHFNPKQLLSDICAVYANMSGVEVFAQAVANDERSYKPQVFRIASAITRKRGLVDSVVAEKFDELAKAASAASSSKQQADSEMMDIPEEFLDPIYYTLMNDPVKCPKSNVTVDRAVILRHLLSDPRDPFNRAPMTADDIIPDTELKARIDEWKKEHGMA